MSIEVISDLAICILQLIAMMIPGFILKKTNLIGESFGHDVTNLILYVAQPFLVITAYITPYDGAIAERTGVVFILAILVHMFLALISLLFFRRTPLGKQRVLRFAFVFSNAGYLGVPLIEYALGSEAVIYASAYIVVFNLFMWTLGYYMYTGERKYMSITKALFNPIAIGTYIGLLIFFFNLHGLFPADGPVFSTFSTLKNMVAPLSMFIIGYRLADAFTTKKCFDLNLLFCIFLRLVLAPIITFLFLFLCYHTGICRDYTAISVVLICASTPAAAATAMLAEKFKSESVYASMAVSLSTIFSLASMPVAALLLYLL